MDGPYRYAWVPPPVRRASWWRRTLRLLPTAWRWVREMRGGHWEFGSHRPEAFVHLDFEKRWCQYDECQYKTFPPYYPCEDHGP